MAALPQKSFSEALDAISNFSVAATDDDGGGVDDADAHDNDSDSDFSFAEDDDNYHEDAGAEVDLADWFSRLRETHPAKLTKNPPKYRDVDVAEHGGTGPTFAHVAEIMGLTREELLKSTVMSSLGHPFIVVSRAPGGFLQQIPARNTCELHGRLCDGVKRWIQELRGCPKEGQATGGGGNCAQAKPVMLCDFEGEMPGFGGELSVAQFLPTNIFNPDTFQVDPQAAPIRQPGILVDMRDEDGIQLVRLIMEAADITKIAWGADGDLTCLLHQPNIAKKGWGMHEHTESGEQIGALDAGEHSSAGRHSSEGQVSGCQKVGIQSRGVVDVQLVYSDSTSHRTGLAAALNWIETRLHAAVLDGLPDKGGHVDYQPQMYNCRCLQFPLTRDLALYAIDDVHRVDRVLRYKPTGRRNFRDAFALTEGVKVDIAGPQGVFAAIERERGYSAGNRLKLSVRIARIVQHAFVCFAPELNEDDVFRLVGLRSESKVVLRGLEFANDEEFYQAWHGCPHPATEPAIRETRAELLPVAPRDCGDASFSSVGMLTAIHHLRAGWRRHVTASQSRMGLPSSRASPALSEAASLCTQKLDVLHLAFPHSDDVAVQDEIAALKLEILAADVSLAGAGGDTQ